MRQRRGVELRRFRAVDFGRPFGIGSSSGSAQPARVQAMISVVAVA